MVRKTRVIGVTGSLGMGKTTVAGQLKALGAHVCNSDAVVHALLAKNGAAVKPVATLFPEAKKDGGIDRAALGRLVFTDDKKRKALEAILHPMVVMVENEFIRAQSRKGARLVVLDIPLLFETGAETRCDAVFVASAPSFVQRQRALARSGMTEEKYRRILSAQFPDRDKRRLADAVILTGLGKAHSLKKLVSVLRAMHAA